MARGKKLTVSQSNILREKKMNPKDWLYVKEEIVTEDGKISRNLPKDRYMVIEHRVSHEQRRVLL